MRTWIGSREFRQVSPLGAGSAVAHRVRRGRDLQIGGALLLDCQARKLSRNSFPAEAVNLVPFAPGAPEAAAE